MLNRRGQGAFEIMLLIIVVLGALLAMNIYMKRGIMGKLRESSDQIGEQFSAQYSDVNLSTSYVSNRNETIVANGLSVSSIRGTENQTRSGYEAINTNLSVEKTF